ncbi:Chorismate mutase 1, chloroplastic [Coccomyxa sp. Obi]|nr:Chorismate mutase 1, chloroplastic [Coccomyxa sp. Obi]
MHPLQRRLQCETPALQTWHLPTWDHSQLQVRAEATSSVATQMPAGPAGPKTLRRNDSIDQSASLSLDNIRQSLIRQEDTIIFSLIERAQFAANQPVYESGAMPVPGTREDGRPFSLLEHMLWETEQMHGKVRRYTSPDEHPFFPNDVPPLILPEIKYAEVLAPCARRININDKIFSLYLDHLIPGITQPGDDNNYGSAALSDVLTLQALSKRIHYGKFVAEAKFRAKPQEYAALIRQKNTDGLMALLTDEAQEAKVVERVRRKAAIYGQDIQGDDTCFVGSNKAIAAIGDGEAQLLPLGGSGGIPKINYKVEPDIVAELYRRWVMPLTKEVQIEYLLQRLSPF